MEQHSITMKHCCGPRRRTRLEFQFKFSQEVHVCTLQTISQFRSKMWGRNQTSGETVLQGIALRVVEGVEGITLWGTSERAREKRDSNPCKAHFICSTYHTAFCLAKKESLKLPGLDDLLKVFFSPMALKSTQQSLYCRDL